ncbi:hypothetical protein [Adhaeribacter terreus]|uniref:Uncharacterized protein n=1 Tax=Adhaeribacter terreus TaxID=529703 RepID=A0ABW0E9R2_9BACT
MRKEQNIIIFVFSQPTSVENKLWFCLSTKAAEGIKKKLLPKNQKQFLTTKA